MKAQDHSEYDAERQRLGDTVQEIDQQLESYGQRKDVDTAYADASEAIAHLLTDSLRKLFQARSDPYFGRFDFCRNGNPGVRTIYIGKEGIAQRGGGNDLVYDWRAPIAELFYVSEFAGASYKAPRGTIRGDVRLRRRFKIVNAELVEISDEVPPQPSVLDTPVTQPLPPDGAEHMRSDEFLLTVLAQHRDARLTDIVATIQAQQNALIRAPLDRVLLIQGVAGSGKTSVALHRIAYLLYAHRDRLDAHRIAVIGPSRLFLQSITDVLPGLGVQDVVQTTFEEWAQGWVNPRVRIDSSDEPLERFLDHAVDRQANVATFLRGRLKGSLKMGRLLREHVVTLRRRFLSDLDELHIMYRLPFDGNDGQYMYRFAGREVAVNLTADEVRSAFGSSQETDANRKQPLNADHDRGAEMIARMLWETFHKLPDASTTGRGQGTSYESARRKHFVTTVRPQIDRILDLHWPRMTAVDCYKRLITNRSHLELVNRGPSMLQKGQLSDGEINLLVGSAEEPGSLKWSFEDLPILCFLELLLNGRSATIYDHMVIDEAQDASPLQVEVLRYHARDGSMTLLGDIAQGVYSYRGIQQWSELREIFQSTHFATAKLAISYRSTYEITVLANRILTRARLPEKIIALPVERHGPPPHLSRCDNWIELVREAITIINDALTNGAHSAAIICKTASICQTFSKTATEIGRTTPTLVLSKASTANPEVMLTPAYLAKGLEFDCVVLAGADAVTFTESEYDAKLVYVSITRALHELHVLWVGEPAILLAPLAVTLNPQ